MMLSWARLWWTIRSPGPKRWPMVATLVAWPPTMTIASSHPRNRASSPSSSRWSGFSPDAIRLADTDVP